MDNNDRFLTRESADVEIIPAEHPDLESYFVTGNTGQGGEAWKLDVGSQCNLLLDMADDLEITGTSMYSEKLTNQQATEMLRALAFRVSEFEELEVEEIVDRRNPE